MHRANVVDTSKWQSEIDWNHMSEHVDAAIIKASQPNTETGFLFTDTEFSNSAARLNEELLPWGAYHFYAQSASPTAQADYFCDLLQEHAGWTLLPVLDVEMRPLAGDQVRACLERIEDRLNVRPMIYTAAGVWNEMGGLLWAKKYLLWVAQYPLPKMTGFEDAEERTPNPLPTDWTTWTMWQFSDKGPGKEWGAGSFGLDLNQVNGPLSILAVGELPEQPEPEPPDPEPEPDGQRYRVLTGVLNVRNQPSTSGPIVGKLYAGVEFISDAETEASGYTWALIEDIDSWVAVSSGLCLKL